MHLALPPALRHPRGASFAAVLATGLATGLAMGIAPAQADPDSGRHDAQLTPRTRFIMQPDGFSGLSVGGEGIPNIDSVKRTIANYYGDPGTGIANKTASPYISEMDSILDAERTKLAPAYRAAVASGKAPAIVLDADDTTLWTYDMEVADMKFVFNPTRQDYWVQNALFPATPGMVDFVREAHDMGFAIFGLTGRNDGQKAATLTNLANVGYTEFNADNFYTKWVSGTPKPDYITCATASCTTVEYKSGTRKHIESLGFDIVLNVGDQWSDLQGGYADHFLKLPNPTYYLPSPDLPGLVEPQLSPRTSFTMEADGSSGLTEGGEGIPNIDSVKKTIAAYYGDTGTGLSSKVNSPYITEVTGIAAAQRPDLVRQCQADSAAGERPAIVFDADDTTLWTYDMEVADMKFVFNPTRQDYWVQNRLFPATPGMVDLVNAVGEAGCTVVGLTGRNTNQRAATLANLADVGYTQFTDGNYYTKWVSGTPMPDYLVGFCPATGSCPTIQYKSGTRAHVEGLGYTIIANFGDQFSDLKGGYADRAMKLPNPTYYLP
jgi:predicted secreted acid phosphatase